MSLIWLYDRLSLRLKSPRPTSRDSKSSTREGEVFICVSLWITFSNDVILHIWMLYYCSQRGRQTTGQELGSSIKTKTNTTHPSTGLLWDLYPENGAFVVCLLKDQLFHLFCWSLIRHGFYLNLYVRQTRILLPISYLPASLVIWSLHQPMPMSCHDMDLKLVVQTMLQVFPLLL